MDPVLPIQAVLTQPLDQAVVVPVIRAKLDRIADMPAGPEAKAAANDLMTLILGFLASIPADSPLKKWAAIIAAVLTLTLTLLGGSFTAGRWTAPATPAVDKTVIVNPPVTPEKPVVPAEKPADGPVVAPVPSQLTKVVLYTTAGVDMKGIAGDAALLKIAKVSVDPGVYVAYKFNGKEVPAPCAALFGADGKVVNVVASTTAADVVAAVQKQQGK